MSRDRSSIVESILGPYDTSVFRFPARVPRVFQLFADSREYSPGGGGDRGEGTRRTRERERSGISWHAISKWYDEYRRAHLGRLTFLQRWFFFLISLGGMSVTKKKKKKASIEDYARSVYACSWITVEFDLEFINNRWKVKMKFGWLDLKINVFLSSWFPIQQYIGIDE